jgi:hypothetical protein
MKRIVLIFALAMLPSFLWISPTNAQALPSTAVLSLAQTERVAVMGALQKRQPERAAPFLS